MSYFSGGEIRDRLTVLYFLNRLGIELTRAQLTTVCAQSELLPYFALQSAVYELETQGLIAAVPRPFGQAYCITPKGEEMLEMFSEQLPLSLRGTLSALAESCREQVLRQTQYTAAFEKSAPDSEAHTVSLAVFERDVALLQLQLMLPDKSSAAQACEAWPAAASAIYQALLENLLSDAEA